MYLQFQNSSKHICPNTAYWCSPSIKSTGFNTLMKYTLLTGTIHKTNMIKSELETADINYKNTQGWTTLMLACKNADTVSSYEIIELLLKSNADVNLQNNLGQTALMLICENKPSITNDKVIKLLLKYNADITLQDHKNETVLTYVLNHAQDKLFFDLEHKNCKCNELIEMLLQNDIMINKFRKCYYDISVERSNSLKINQYANLMLLLEKYNAFETIHKTNDYFEKYELEAMEKENNYFEKKHEIEPEKIYKLNDCLEKACDIENIINHNFNILNNLKHPQKMIVGCDNKLELDHRWFQPINRYWTNDSRRDLLEPIKFTFDNLKNIKSKEETLNCLNIAKQHMKSLYPYFTDLHDLFDHYITMSIFPKETNIN